MNSSSYYSLSQFGYYPIPVLAETLLYVLIALCTPANCMYLPLFDFQCWSKYQTDSIFSIESILFPFISCLVDFCGCLIAYCLAKLWILQFDFHGVKRIKSIFADPLAASTYAWSVKAARDGLISKAAKSRFGLEFGEKWLKGQDN